MPVAAAVRGSKKVYDSPEELHLVHAARRGDQRAFNSLYDMHHTRVFVTIKRLLASDDDSHWVANMALTKVWKKLNTFKENSKFSTWITRIAINEAKMHLRSQKRHLRDLSLDTMLMTVPDANASPSRTDPVDPALSAHKWLAQRDLNLEGICDRHMLERAITRVPTQFRRTLRLRFWEGLSLDEIKTTLSVEEAQEVSISAVKSRILRGRAALIEQIERIS
jgi:RNA polymerase sigma-70 factor (ECF subfamily)